MDHHAIRWICRVPRASALGEASNAKRLSARCVEKERSYCLNHPAGIIVAQVFGPERIFTYGSLSVRAKENNSARSIGLACCIPPMIETMSNRTMSLKTFELPYKTRKLHFSCALNQMFIGTRAQESSWYTRCRGDQRTGLSERDEETSARSDHSSLFAFPRTRRCRQVSRGERRMYHQACQTAQ